MRKLRVSQPLTVVMLAVVVTFGAVALLPYKPGLAVNDERMTSGVQAVANVTNTKDQIDRPLFHYQGPKIENPQKLRQSGTAIST